ncbi:hypothetical protein O3M35_001017 [Rhynocoris fuscipes]|uniref:Uncharacterized protein n=1 Tax=Rhynocoris fuscipes TaxID=488301 RepID=A0AAW1DQC7_9HEMI
MAADEGRSSIILCSICEGKFGSLDLMECGKLHWLCLSCDKVEVSSSYNILLNNLIKKISVLTEEIYFMKEIMLEKKSVMTCSCSCSNGTSSYTELCPANNNSSINENINNTQNKADIDSKNLNKEGKQPNITSQRGNYVKAIKTKSLKKRTDHDDSDLEMPNLTLQCNTNSKTLTEVEQKKIENANDNMGIVDKVEESNSVMQNMSDNKTTSGGHSRH